MDKIIQEEFYHNLVKLHQNKKSKFSVPEVEQFVDIYEDELVQHEFVGQIKNAYKKCKRKNSSTKMVKQYLWILSHCCDLTFGTDKIESAKSLAK
jgi:hypothetical protein